MQRIEERKVRPEERDSRKPGSRTVEEQAAIGEAKALLMAKNHLTEEEAHKFLQKCSMDSGINLVETAEKLLYIAAAAAE